MESEQTLSLVKAALASPVTAGTLAYLGVSAIERIDTALKTTTKDPTKPAPPPSIGENFLRGFLNTLLPNLPGLPNVGNAAADTAEGLLANIDYTALKIAILAYIASGGNLAGLLASGAGGLSSLTNLLKGAAK